MQTSLIKKLLHPIKELRSLRARRPSEEISELREADKMQNAECEMQNEALLAAEVTAEEMEESLSPDGEDNLPEDEANEPTPSFKANTKAHLSSSVPRAASVPRGVLTKGEMAEIRSIFGDMDDAEIQRLYKRVTK